MTPTDIAEPEFLVNRRAAAAAVVESTPLPQHKGAAGWEFTLIGDLDLGALADEADKQAEAAGEAHKDFFQRIRDALGDAVGEVRASSRLTESPACLTRGEDDMGEQMRRILAAAGRDLPSGKPRLEVNLGHPLVARLEKVEGDDFSELAQLLFDQAQLTEQGQVANPGDYVRRLNRLLVKLVGTSP